MAVTIAKQLKKDSVFLDRNGNVISKTSSGDTLKDMQNERARRLGLVPKEEVQEDEEA
jgi:hypothetical protein